MHILQYLYISFQNRFWQKKIVFLQGVLILLNMFAGDFDDQIGLYATLVDPNNNEFHMLVKRFNGSVFLTKGWPALVDLYDIRLGAWITMNFVGLGRFTINLKDMVGWMIIYPKFDPPMRIVVERVDVNGYVPNGILPPYQHCHVNFQFSYEKRLSSTTKNQCSIWSYKKNTLIFYNT